MDKIKAILFGLTGQGNSAFNVLLRHPIFNLVGVFTRKKFDAPYPYYLRKQLNQIVEENRKATVWWPNSLEFWSG